MAKILHKENNFVKKENLKDIQNNEVHAYLEVHAG